MRVRKHLSESNKANEAIEVFMASDLLSCIKGSKSWKEGRRRRREK
jgi:hypothetical protein